MIPSATNQAAGRPRTRWAGAMRALTPAWPAAPLTAFAVSRAMVALVAMFAVISFSPGPTPLTLGAKHPFSGWPAGGLLDWVFASLAQWDAGHYLEIAAAGYDVGSDGGPTPRAAFFPLYPLLVRIVAAPFGASPGVVLIAAVFVSLAAFAAALVILHRLVALELGAERARLSVWLLALFPGAVFFSAPYSESVFLLTTVGAFYAARRGNWLLAGICAALASSTRLVGLAVVVPLLIMYLWGPRADAEAAPRSGWRPRFELRPNVLWLALAPVGLIAFSAYLAARTGDALAWSNMQTVAFQRVNELPFVTAWIGVTDAWNAVKYLDLTLAGHVPTGAGFDWGRAIGITVLMELGLLVFALVAIVGAFRQLPLAYGAFALVSLLMVLSSRLDSPGTIALQALHRYLAVIFPLFIWLAVWSHRRGWGMPVAAAFAVGLGMFTALFATSHWLL